MLAPHAHTCRDLPRFILFVYLTWLSWGQLNWSISRRSPLIDLLTKFYSSKFHVVQPAGLPPGCATFYSACRATCRAPPGLRHIYFQNSCCTTCRAPPGLCHIYFQNSCCTTRRAPRVVPH